VKHFTLCTNQTILSIYIDSDQFDAFMHEYFFVENFASFHVKKM